MRRITCSVTTLACALALAACGGDDDGNGSGTGKQNSVAKSVATAPPPVAAEVWVKRVCTGISLWVTKFQDASMLESAIKETASEGLPEARDALGAYFGNVIDDTVATIAGLKASGEPDVEGGAKAAAAVIALMDKVRGVLEATQERVAKVSVADAAAFQTGVGVAMAAFGAETSKAAKRLQATIGGAAYPELEQAGKAEPACKELSQT